jgi:hypothetical protein
MDIKSHEAEVKKYAEYLTGKGMVPKADIDAEKKKVQDLTK